jgi:hypothetical protein
MEGSGESWIKGVVGFLGLVGEWVGQMRGVCGCSVDDDDG